MKKAVKKTREKYLTERKFQSFERSFEENMRSIAKSFARVDESFATNAEVMGLILKEIKTIHEDNKYFRQSITTLNLENVSRDKKIKGLDLRVEKLEVK